MPLLTSIINWLNVKRVHQLDLVRKYPAEVQEETFTKLISKAQSPASAKVPSLAITASTLGASLISNLIPTIRKASL